MAGTLLPFPFHQFLDANGDPLSSGKVHVFLSGTTTESNSYTDAALSTPHTNPIVLNAAGRPPSPIWIPPDISLKIVLTTSTDTDPPTSPIWTVDPVLHEGAATGTILYSSYTDVGNVGAGEDNLHVYAIPANTITVDGDAIRITAWGTNAANANAKQLRLYFGTLVLLDTGTPTTNGGSWRFQAEVVRTGSAAQRATTVFFREDAALGNAFRTTYALGTQVYSAGFNIKVTGQCTSDNDVIQKGMLVEKIVA
jgi:hypothetical protein